MADEPEGLEAAVGRDDIASIARGLSGAQREAVLYLSDEFSPGPDLPDRVIRALSHLRDLGLVDRVFMDRTPVRKTGGKDGLTLRLSACWWFGLTPLGLRVRAFLRA